MTSVGWSTLDVIPTVKNLRSELEKQTSRDFAAAGRKGGQQFGDAAGKEAGGRFKQRFSPLLRNALAPLAGVAAGAGIASLFKGAIDEASALAESGNKIDVVFGDAGSQINKFAEGAADSIGQSELAARNAAATMGVFGKAAGLTGDELAGFSTQLTSLASDLASFYDTSVEQATQALGSGLRGEAEPLRQYGVLLDDATLRQEALRQGLIETTKQALTPQQKILAAHAVILEQTADAQGDFTRTSDGLANSQRQLSADWANMRAELGEKLLPATQAFVGFLKDEGLPALSATGGVVADVGRAFNDLPGPVKASAGAFVLLRLASATGITSAVASGATSAGSALVGLRIRALLAADAFAVQAAQGGRLTASLAAVRAASVGAGAGIQRGLSGALGLVGGPWGAAFIAGTAIVTKFWLEHQKAKQRVDELSASLDQQTGAITDNTRELAAKQLADAGALAAAERLGVSLELVTSAALREGDAYASLANQMRVRGQLDDEAAADAIKVKQAIDGTNGSLKDAISSQRLISAALGTTATASDRSATSATNYATALDKARDAVQDLLDKENERRNRRANAFRDETRLADAVASARKEAREGKRTLDENTEAGRANRDALSDLIDAWNGSAESVQKAKGAYKDIRQQFIDVAESMGASNEEAKKLARRFLDLPSPKLSVTTPGMDAALEEVKRLNRELRNSQRLSRIVITAQATAKQKEFALGSYATGGRITGPGSGTSDSVLMWGSNGEFVHRQRAVDYYGVDFMERVNNLQLPKYANGGVVGGGSGGGSSVTYAGPLVNIENMMPANYAEFSQFVNRQAEAARRASTSDGIRR